MKYNIQLVGVGGQGVLLASTVLGNAAVAEGLQVAMSEVHGMAQRGGSVINHTRIGCSFSPLVALGSADLLVALEPGEALRFARYLSPEGVALVNTRPVLPATVTAGLACYPPIPEILSALREHCRRVVDMDATALASQAGTAQAMNVVMLGALSSQIPLSEDDLLCSLAQVVPARFLEANKRAFALGKAEVE